MMLYIHRTSPSDAVPKPNKYEGANEILTLNKMNTLEGRKSLKKPPVSAIWRAETERLIKK